MVSYSRYIAILFDIQYSPYIEESLVFTNAILIVVRYGINIVSLNSGPTYTNIGPSIKTLSLITDSSESNVLSGRAAGYNCLENRASN